MAFHVDGPKGHRGAPPATFFMLGGCTITEENKLQIAKKIFGKYDILFKSK